MFIFHSPVVASVEPNTVGAKAEPSTKWKWLIEPSQNAYAEPLPLPKQPTANLLPEVLNSNTEFCAG